MASDEEHDEIPKLTEALIIALRSRGQSVPVPDKLDLASGSKLENLERFKREFQDYLLASGREKDPENEKAALLRASIGKEGRDLIYTIQFDNDEPTVDDIFGKLKEKIVPVDYIVYARYEFQTTNQGDETFDDYLLKLQKLLKSANYEKSKNSLNDDILRDRIVVGVKNVELRRKLLKISELTLAKAIAICKAEETVAGMMSSSEQVKKIEQKVANYKKLCKFCGFNHEFKAELCPARKKVCNGCRKVGHFIKMCPDKVNRVKEVAIEEHKEKESFGVLKISSEKNDEDFHCDLWLKIGYWKKHECLMDTGANVNVIGVNYLKKNDKYGSVKIFRSNKKITTFGGHAITVVGQAQIQLKYRGNKHSVMFQVTAEDHCPLLSGIECKRIGLIKICAKLTDKNVNNGEEIVLSTKKIIDEFSDVFQGIGLMPGEVELEVDENVKPMKQPPRRIPIAKQSILRNEIEAMVRDDIIVKEESPTDWCSNIVLLQRDGKTRVVLDPIPLNKALKRTNYQMPMLEEVLPNLGKAKVFTKLDAKKGFWQMKLTEKSSKLTTFWTPFGRYRWLRLPFGISPAPELFQQKQHEILQGLDGVEVIADDLIVFGCGDSHEEAVLDHNMKLEKLLKRLREVGVKLNPDKMDVCCDEITFFGHVISSKGVKADPKKIAAISNMETPKSKEDVHRFIGMVTYLGKFIKNLSHETEMLRRLVHKNVEFAWGDTEEMAFKRIKNIISETVTLKFVDVKRPLVIESDASSFALGACLLQDEFPIHFASKVLTTTERKYAQIEKELLAILFACRRFDQYIVGNKQVTVRTDHNPLVGIFKKPIITASRRIQVMMLALQRYNLNIEYVPGKELVIPDTISRAPDTKSEIEQYEIFELKSMEILTNVIEEQHAVPTLYFNEEKRLEELKEATNKDESLWKVKKFIEQGWPEYKCLDETVKVYHKYKDELHESDGLVLKLGRIVVPMAMRKIMTQKLHLAHLGLEYTLNLARDVLFWPGMYKQVQDSVTACEACMKFSSSQQKQPMMSHQVPQYPFQFVSMDAFEVNIYGKKRNYLILVDEYSDFFEFRELSSMSSAAVIKICKAVFCTHGVPERLCSDSATNFMSSEFKEFSRQWEFELVTSAPHHQQGNGRAEAAVKSAKMLIHKAESEKVDVEWCLLNHRNTPNKKGSSPVQRLFARRTRCSIPMTKEMLKPTVIEDTPEIIEKSKKQAKKYYDRNTKPLHLLKEGEIVMVQLKPHDNWTKGVVVKQLDERNWLVKVDGTVYRRNREFIKSASISTEQTVVQNDDDDDDVWENAREEIEVIPQQVDEQEYLYDEIVPQAVPEPMNEEEQIPVASRPQRARRLPERFKEYEMDFD